MKRFWRIRPLAVGGLLAAAVAAAHATPTGGGFDYTPLEDTLRTYVNDRGLVNYNELKAHRQGLDEFVSQMGALSPETYEAWQTNEKIAFWINAYNSLTLRAIVDHYPIHAGFFSSFVYPSNSIRQIDGVWTDLKFVVMGKELTLDHIEHQILRKKFEEPRIHMALVCAALSCPPLRAEPYLGDKLDQQLEDQANKFLRRRNNFRVERSARGKGTVHLSSIFDWFGGDFQSKYGTENDFRGKSDSQRAVLNFILPHVPEVDRQYLKSGEYSISYTKYDWTLNEQK